MVAIPLHPNSTQFPISTGTNPLPQLLQTPSGLALLELQGTINLPEHDDEDTIALQETPIGRLIFAEYDPHDPNNTAWMKRVYLYVGKHQRLSGEVKKLPKAIAIIRKRVDDLQRGPSDGMAEVPRAISDELEIVEIVKWKILFSTRPEPVGARPATNTGRAMIYPTPLTPISLSSCEAIFPLYKSAEHKMSPAYSSPEAYFIRHSTPTVPNSTLPVLVYRSALNDNLTPETTCEIIEPNNWIKGGVFKHYAAHHFHSVTHECYAVFKGRSKLLLGRGPLDPATDQDLEIDLETGDAIVLPAGVAHCSLSSSDDYEYVGLYPKGSPHWDNNFCKASVEETGEKAANARNVPIPDYDPVFGLDGPLVKIWRDAALSG